MNATASPMLFYASCERYQHIGVSAPRRHQNMQKVRDWGAISCVAETTTILSVKGTSVAAMPIPAKIQICESYFRYRKNKPQNCRGVPPVRPQKALNTCLITDYIVDAAAPLAQPYFNLPQLINRNVGVPPT